MDSNPWGPPVTVSNGNAGWSIRPTDQELVEAAKRYIQSQNVTLWGQSFNVHDEEADVAAEWLAKVVRAVWKEAAWPTRTVKL